MIVSFCSLNPQTGKSTCANYYSKKTGAMILEFSYPIEIMAKDLYGYTGPKSDPEQRKILQDFGLSCKSIDPDYWSWRLILIAANGGFIDFDQLKNDHVDHFKKLVISSKYGLRPFFRGEEPNLVLSGMRSSQEANFFKKIGAKIYLVTKTLNSGKENDYSYPEGVNPALRILLKKGWHDHAVESQLYDYEGFDAIIENNGTLEDLRSKVDLLIS